ncbi:MAG: M28 family peptidase [Gemmatimonadota bacterium]
MNRLTELGFETQVQEATRVRARGDEAVAVTIRNLVGRRAGSASTGSLLLVAHYDSRALSPGAGDDATGVAVLLESLRAIQAELPLANDLVVLLTDGEEFGLHGARAFAQDHPWMADVRLVLNVEMRGSGGPSLMFETGADNGWIVDQLAQADPSPVANSLFVEIYRRLPNDTDFTAFVDAGRQGLNFAAIGRPENYHQATDTPGNLQEATVQHHGIRILSLVRHLGAADLTTVDAPDRSFLRIPMRGLVTPPTAWAWPLTLAVMGGVLLAVFLATLRGARSRGIILGSVLSILAVAVAAATGWLIFRWAAPMHEEVGALTPAFHDEGPYRFALAFLCLAFTVGLFEAARPWVRPLEASLGALLLPTVVLAAMTLTAPGAAINLQLPLAAVVTLLLVLALMGPKRSRGMVAWILTLLLTLPVFLLLTPLVELLGIALGMGAAAVLAGFITLGLLIVLPALEFLDTPNRWWASLTALLCAAAGLGVGMLQAEPASERPAPSTLIHVGRHRRPSSMRWPGARTAHRTGPGG